MSEWVCGRECKLWRMIGTQTYLGIPEPVGKCRGILRRDGSKCRYTLAAMENDCLNLLAAIAARKAKEATDARLP